MVGRAGATAMSPGPAYSAAPQREWKDPRTPMCVLCYELAAEDHWSDGVISAGAEQMPGRSRFRRTRVLAAVLAAYGLTVSDPGSGPYCVIADRKGAAEVVAGLPGIWQAADRLSPREVDVLDPVLLDAFDASGHV